MRGKAYAGKKEYEKAARDFDEAARLDPNHPDSPLAKAKLFAAQSDYDSAQKDFREMAERFPRSATAHNSLAWFLATCPEAAHRNGTDAVAHARKPANCRAGTSPIISIPWRRLMVRRVISIKRSST